MSLSYSVAIGNRKDGVCLQLHGQALPLCHAEPKGSRILMCFRFSITESLVSLVNIFSAYFTFLPPSIRLTGVFSKILALRSQCYSGNTVNTLNMLNVHCTQVSFGSWSRRCLAAVQWRGAAAGRMPKRILTRQTGNENLLSCSAPPEIPSSVSRGFLAEPWQV